MISTQSLHKTIPFVIATLFSVLLWTSVEASMGSVAKCDALTADHEDPQRVGKAVDDEQLDLDVALENCEQALKTDPENPRIQFQLAKVLYFRGKTDKAIGLLKKVE